MPDLDKLKYSNAKFPDAEFSDKVGIAECSGNIYLNCIQTVKDKDIMAVASSLKEGENKIYDRSEIDNNNEVVGDVSTRLNNALVRLINNRLERVSASSLDASLAEELENYDNEYNGDFQGRFIIKLEKMVVTKSKSSVSTDIILYYKLKKCE